MKDLFVSYALSFKNKHPDMGNIIIRTELDSVEEIRSTEMYIQKELYKLDPYMYPEDTEVIIINWKVL